MSFLIPAWGSATQNTQNTQNTVCGLVLVSRLLLVCNKIRTEIETKHLENFIAILRGNCMPMESSNNAIWSYILYVFVF